MKCSWLSKDYPAQVSLQNLSACCPNKCLECVKHGAEWPQEEKSIAIHISYVYNCLWKHGTGLFCRAASPLPLFLSSFLMDVSFTCFDLQWSRIWDPPPFFFHVRIPILITGTLDWVWSVHWTVDRHRPCPRNGYFDLRFLKLWVFSLFAYSFRFEVGAGSIVEEITFLWER